MRLRLLFSVSVGLVAAIGCGKVNTASTDGPIDAVTGPDGVASPDGAGTCAPACAINATCTGTTCACNGGYMGDGLTCADINECATNNGGCDVNANCLNAPGSSSCLCKPGFVGDGITCRASWTRVATVPNVALDLGNNRGFMAVGLAPNIYFAPIYDTVQTTFRAINITTGTISGNLALPPGTQSDFQASGFGAIFVTDGVGLYLIGDDGQRYNPATNVWASVPGYMNSGLRRGESAGAYVPAGNAILMIGGRDEATNQYQGSALRYDVGGTFKAEPGALPYQLSYAGAYAFAGSDTAYVVGGSASDNSRRHLAVHKLTTGTWTTLADAPADIGEPTGIGQFDSGGVSRLLVAAGAKAYFYEPTSGTWDHTIDLPSMARSRVVMVGGAPYAIVQNGTGVDIFKLSAIE
jgi:hypothetical protein